MKNKIATQLPTVSPSLSPWIILILSLCFINSYDGDFVFDDTEAIVNNNDVSDTPLWEVFQNDFWGTKLSHKQSHKSYRPLTILSFRLQFWLRQGLVSQDYHIINIILHSVICLLTFFVYNIFLGPEGYSTSFYAAALFAVHPIHTEAVSGIVGRAELLSSLFTWLSILLYSHTIQAKDILHVWAAMSGFTICITAAMLCKETGITSIGICAVYDIVIVNKIYPIDVINFFSFKRTDKKSNNFIKYKNTLLRLAALIFIAITLLLLRFSVMGFSTPKFQSVDNPASFMDNVLLRILNYNYIYCLNMWLFICPVWLCFDWSMGCVSLITGYDYRILVVIVFWFVFGTLITYMFISHKNKTLRLNPNYAQAMNNLGNLLKDDGQLLEAISLFKQAVNLQKDFSTAWMNLGIVQSALKKYEESEASYFTALQYRSNYPDCYYNLGVLYLEQKQHDKALKAWINATRQKPTHKRAWTNMILLLDDLGKTEEALKTANEALKFIPNHASIYFNVANILGKKGKYKEAEIQFKRAISEDSTSPMIYANLGVLYHRWNKLNAAEEMYKKALQLKPDLYSARDNLQKLYTLKASIK
ncbi:protein O-mannosyl-transferase TMTC4 isoform X7 [Solenopsis invicta]|uniref:protein O-mannosyl-transferase TMTC4 isoform X7 n=1 Tax=Solenopsis invicta TaxID=13686 RepID=UPI00193D7322|nr:protein O-mannosyl-transferase TMTC4 isoform X7 [Solenopsis invicta]